MGIIIRQSVKASVVTYAGVALGAFSFLWLFPRFASEEQIGLYKLIQSLGLLLAMFVQFGATGVVERFFPYFKDRARQHHGFLPFVLLYPLPGLLLFGVAWLLFRDFWLSLYAAKAPQVNAYFWWFVPLTVFLIYQGVLDGYARVHLRIVVPSLFREVGLRVAAIGLMLAFATGLLPFSAVVVGYILGIGVGVVGLMLYLRNLGVWFVRFSGVRLSKPLLRQMASFSLVIVLGGTSSVVISQIDSVMIGSLYGIKEVGVYAIAFFIGTVIEIPRRMISQISIPLLAQAWKDDDLPKIAEIYRKASLNQMIVGMLLLLGIWANSEAIFHLIPNGHLYRPGRYVILFIGLARLIDMTGGLSSEIITQSRYYAFTMWSSASLAGLLVVTNLVLIPRFGITGAALATALSVLTYVLIKFLFIRWRFGLQPFTWRTLFVPTLAGAVWLVAGLVPPPPPDLPGTLLNVALRSVVITVLFLGPLLLLRISPDANGALQAVWSNLRRR
ncbi:MAG: polysaccharide biosynthesis C-terminal domain-containing protein [Catalinimonas sp.]